MVTGPLRQTVLLRFFLFAVTGLILAAAYGSQAYTQSKTKPTEAVMFDSYGRIGGCDHSARLDNLAIFLQNEPTFKAFIMTYGPEGEGSGTGRGILETIKNYLVMTRAIEENRIETIYGGRSSVLGEPVTELWLAPSGALPPEKKNHQNDIASFRGKIAEFQAWDYVGSLGEGEAPGLPFGNVTVASILDLMSQQKTAIVYIVAFNGTDAAPGAWRRVGRAKLDLFRQRGVETNRVKLLHGGDSKETSIQLWLLPADAPPPVSEVRETLPTKTVQIGSFNDYNLADSENERWAFNGLVDVLREGEHLRACLIVRLGSVQDEENSLEHDFAVEPYYQPVNLAELVQKWTAELAEKLKIGPDRFIVLFASPRGQMETNTIETWVVPPGALLPDPNAPRTDESLEEEEEEPLSHSKSPGLQYPGLNQRPGDPGRYRRASLSIIG